MRRYQIRRRIQGQCFVEQERSRTAIIRVHASDFNCDGFYDDRDFEVFAAAYDIMLCTTLRCQWNALRT